MWKEWTKMIRLNKSQIQFSSFFHLLDLCPNGYVFLLNGFEKGLKFYNY